MSDGTTGAPLDLDGIEARAIVAMRAPVPLLTLLASEASALCQAVRQRDAEIARLRARLDLISPTRCGRCEATLHPERRERTLCRHCQTDAIREGVRRAWRNRRAALAAPEPGR